MDASQLRFNENNSADNSPKSSLSGSDNNGSRKWQNSTVGGTRSSKPTKKQPTMMISARNTARDNGFPSQNAKSLILPDADKKANSVRRSQSPEDKK